MEVVFGLVCLFAAVTVIGHGLWVLLATILRAIFGGSTSNRTRTTESADIAATQRQLDRLNSLGLVKSETREELSTALEQRGKDLGLRQPARIVPAGPLPPEKELERLLASFDGLNAQGRARVLSLHDQATAEQIKSLGAARRYDLARVLEMSGRPDDAIQVYQELLDDYPEHEGFVQTSIRAARLAAVSGRAETALSIAERALSRDPSTRARQELAELLEELPTEVSSAAPPTADDEEIAWQEESEPPAGEPEVVEAPATPVDEHHSADLAEEIAPAEPIAEVDAPEAKPAEPDIAWVEDEPASELPKQEPLPETPEVAASPASVARETQPPPPEPAPPPQPKKPRRSFSELLASFMEERNIRWGEIVGGMLIVGCSIALVVSLRETLQAFPYFQFLIFAAVTGSLFGVGLYTERRWKLEATSRGLLIIASLLVPLNFVALAKLSASGASLEAMPWLPFVVEGGAVAFFFWLARAAARILAPSADWMMTLGVMGGSAAMLPIARLVGPEPHVALVLALGMTALLGHMVALGVVLLRDWRADELTSQDAHVRFVLLGTVTFAALAALGLLVFQVDKVAATLDHLAVLLPLAGVPIAACGLTIRQKLQNDPEAAGQRTAATAVGLCGIVLMLAALLLAWPLPLDIVLVALVNVAALCAIAFCFRLPLAHAAAMVCLGISYLTSFHWLAGHLDVAREQLGWQLLQMAVHPQSGTALVGLFLLLAVAGEILTRRNYVDHGIFYLGGAGAVAVMSLSLVSLNGYAHPLRAAIVYGIYAAGCLSVNLRARKPAMTYTGLALLLATTCWSLGWAVAEFSPTWPAALAAEALLFAGAAQLILRGRKRATDETAADRSSWEQSFAVPLFVTGEIIAWPVIGLGIFSGMSLADGVPWAFAHVVTALSLAGCYLLTFLHWRRGHLARMTGLMLLGAVVAGGGWTGTRIGSADLPLLIALWVSAASLGMAALAVASGARLVRQDLEADSQRDLGGLPWQTRLGTEWLYVATETGLLALVLCLVAPSTFVAGAATWGFPAVVALCLAASAFLLAWGTQSSIFSGAGASLALAGVLYAFAKEWHDLLPRPWELALLTHATVSCLAGFVLNGWIQRGENREGLRGLYQVPISAVGILSSMAVVPLVLVLSREETLWIAGCLFWLTALWLVLAWVNRWPLLLTGAQVVLALAFGFATTHWLRAQPWSADLPAGLADPWCLQAYGSALGLLGVIWAGLRIGLKNHETARELMNPPWPAFDRLLSIGLVVAHLGLLAFALVPGVFQELTPRGGTLPAMAPITLHSFDVGGWLVLVILTAGLGVALWDRWRDQQILAALALAISIPLLVAGRFSIPAELATATALRWGLGLGMLLLAALFWWRGRLLAALGKMHGRVETETRAAQWGQALLLLATLAPVLVLTGMVAMLGFSGTAPSGPATTSVFHPLGFVIGNIGPLVLVTLALVGFALRESSPAYAFGGGLVAEGTVVGGYALMLTTAGRSIDAQQLVIMLQLGTITAAVWALGWLIIRRVARRRYDLPESRLANPLMVVQIGLAAIGNVILLMSALFVLGLFWPNVAWSEAAGSWLGWAALGLAAAAGALRGRLRRHRLRPEIVGLIGLATLGLLACSVESLFPGWGYRTLMLGWAAYALCVVLAVWWVSVQIKQQTDAAEPPRSLMRTASIWVRFAGILAVLLGLKAAFVHVFFGSAYQEDALWGAGAIALASLAGAAMAIWLRREGWAFTAGLGVNLAASIVVWYREGIVGGRYLDDWWLILLQGNLIAGAAVALLWLAARRRLYDTTPSLRASPLLYLQILLIVAGNAGLLAAGAFRLFIEPHTTATGLAALGEPPAWLALLSLVSACIWWTAQSAPRRLTHVLAAGGLGLGVLVAYSLEAAGPQSWLRYHALLATWAISGYGLLACYLVAQLWEEKGPTRYVSAIGVETWGVLVAGLVVLFGIRAAWDDPSRPVWPGGAILAASILVGGLAHSFPRARHVVVSGVLINVVGLVVLAGYDSLDFTHVMLVNAACFALAATAWTLIGQAWQAGLPAVESASGPIAYPHLAAPLSILCLAGWVTAAVAAEWSGSTWDVGIWLPWLACAASAIAICCQCWDRDAQLIGPGAYLWGLAATGLLLVGRDLARSELLCQGAVLGGGFLLVASMVVFAARSLKVSLPPLHRDESTAWFFPAQAAVMCAVITEGIAISLLLETFVERLLAIASGGLVAVAGLLLAKQAAGRWQSGWQYSVRLAAALVAVELGWIFIPLDEFVWLHRTAVLFLAGTALMWICTFGLPRLVPGSVSWRQSGQGMLPLVASAMVLIAAAMHFQEWALWKGIVEGTKMFKPLVIAVVAAYLVLGVTAIRVALLPKYDPCGLSDRGRQGYVYLAELFVLLLSVHLWFTGQDLLRLEIVRNTWPLILMLVAFLGAGLSELFRRRQQEVLAEPLSNTAVLLPLLPALGSLLSQAEPLREIPVFDFFARAFVDVVVWMLVAGFYLTLAVIRKKLHYWVLSAVAANLALWVGLLEGGLTLVDFPQLWLIPPAVAMLIAEYLNHDKLAEQQSSSIRYFCLAVIYLSSTFNMFYVGLGNSWILPLVLMVLSVVGVLLGILLRVRPFLLLGVAFLLVVISSMIWHAAVTLGNTWIWYVSGIVLGIAIIALFAFFEKRRQDVLAALESFREWE